MASAAATAGSAFGRNALPLGVQDNVLAKAQEKFISSLPIKERQIFTPCISIDHLIQETGKLDIIAKKGFKGKRWLSIVQNFAERLEPSFKIIEIFVSSNPEHAALFWGSLRLVLKIAGDYSTFFEKLAQLLEKVTDTLPQYEELLRLCNEKGKGFDDEANRNRMQGHIELLYEDMFRILHITASIFIKPDGDEKKAPVVAAKLIWKPFEARFGEVINRMKDHRRFVLQQLIIWHASESSKEMARAAADRDTDAAEREDAAEERRLADRERDLMQREREASERNRLEVLSQLRDMKRLIRALENERMGNVVRRIQDWISPPDYADRYDKALEKRADGTTRWLFEERVYKDWVEMTTQETPSAPRQFGSNTLWIQGHPGAGKTVLAASIVEDLKMNDLGNSGGSSIYQYFFQHQSPEACRPSDAFRAVLAQLLWMRRADKGLLDRLTFMVQEGGQGQSFATDAELLDVLRLCLENDATVVLDGIDECNDDESLVESLLQLSQDVPALRLLFISRVNVPPLSFSVQGNMKFGMPKSQITLDIRLYFMNKIQTMVDRDTLPSSSASKRQELAEKLCKGADGMFLWAQLMSRCLASPYMTKEQRLDMIDQVNVPEGLEKMYERIVAIIHKAGASAVTLASKALTWLAFSTVPLTSRQLRQAMSTQSDPASKNALGEIHEFEQCVIMACAGLVEPFEIGKNPECPEGESALRFYHLSLDELVKGISRGTDVSSSSSIHSMPQIVFPAMSAPGQGHDTGGPSFGAMHSFQKQGGAQSVSPVFQPLIAAPSVSNLIMAACCLQQILYHTPAQPLSGKLSNRVSEATLNETHCFTSYASVHWLSHLDKCKELMKDSTPPPQSMMMDLIKLLSVFVSKPRVLSTWLEGFYTSGYQRRVVGYRHPPLAIVLDWIELAFTGHQLSVPGQAKELHDTMHSLALDMRTIVQTWDEQLEKTPETVWDEMTYFAKSDFFFSPNSINITIQEPTPPKSQGISKDPVAKMSRTSADGSMKGILCIWAPPEIYDRHVFTKLRVTDRNRYTNVRSLCTGWIATYHVWRMTNPDEPAAKIEIDLKPEDVLGPVRKYLDFPITDGLDFPLAISPDALSVCILNTLYRISPGENQAQSKVFSHRLASDGLVEPDFMWTAPDQVVKATVDYYSFYFSPTSQFLLSFESIQNCTRLVMHECYLETNSNLLVGRVNGLEMSSRAENIANLCFHPSKALLVFSGKLCIDHFRKDKMIFAWKYRSEQTSIEYLPLLNSWSPKSITFSSCGKFIVVQPDFPSNAQPEVLNCPKVVEQQQLLTSSDPTASESSNHPSSKSSSLALTASDRSRGIQQAAPLPTSLTQVVACKYGTQVSVDQKTNDGVESTKVVTLPRSVGSKGVTHTVLVPEAGENMYKVSIDMDRRSHYSLLDREDGPQAAVIERHRAYVTAMPGVNRASALTLGEVSPGPSTTRLELETHWETIRGRVVGERLLEGGEQQSGVPSIATGTMTQLGNSTDTLEKHYGEEQDGSESEYESSDEEEDPVPPRMGVFGSIMRAPANVLGWFIPGLSRPNV